MKNLLILFAIIALASCKKDECPEPDLGEKKTIDFTFKCDAPRAVTLVFDQQVFDFQMDSGTRYIAIEYYEKKPEVAMHYFYVTSHAAHSKPLNIKWWQKNHGSEYSIGGGTTGNSELSAQAIYLP